MTRFIDTNEAREFIATADSRETSKEVMAAIAFHANDAEEAEFLWENAADPDQPEGEPFCLAIVETASKNGLISYDDLYWGGRTLTRILAEE